MKPSHETSQKQAQECIEYYEGLLDRDSLGQNWALGLFMAKQWHRMLQAEKPNVEEVRLFSAALNTIRELAVAEVRSGVLWHGALDTGSNRLNSPINHATS